MLTDNNQDFSLMSAARVAKLEICSSQRNQAASEYDEHEEEGKSDCPSAV
jgi:hypothetical protein